MGDLFQEPICNECKRRHSNLQYCTFTGPEEGEEETKPAPAPKPRGGPIQRCYTVVKQDNRGNIMTILAVFMDRQVAWDWAENANAWYGQDHPLTPLTVTANDALFEPRQFPVRALRGR